MTAAATRRRARRAALAAPPGETRAERRERLRLRSAALRVKFAHEVRALRAPLAAIDTIADGARWLGRHPQWPLAAAALAVVARPRRAMRWAMRGWTVWRLWGRVSRLAAALLRPSR